MPTWTSWIWSAEYGRYYMYLVDDDRTTIITTHWQDAAQAQGAAISATSYNATPSGQIQTEPTVSDSESDDGNEYDGDDAEGVVEQAGNQENDETGPYSDENAVNRTNRTDSFIDNVTQQLESFQVSTSNASGHTTPRPQYQTVSTNTYSAGTTTAYAAGQQWSPYAQASAQGRYRMTPVAAVTNTSYQVVPTAANMSNTTYQTTPYGTAQYTAGYQMNSATSIPGSTAAYQPGPSPAVQAGPSSNAVGTLPADVQADIGYLDRRFIRTAPDPYDMERLDPRYRRIAVRSHAQFFVNGRVFKMLWTEPAGQYQPGKTRNSTHFSMTWRGEHAYSEIRRFVVVRNKGTFSQCIPIQTYKGQGATKQGLNMQDHGIIFTANNAPDPLPNEVLTKTPIRCISTGDETLDDTSRVNYGKSYAVEHNVKVLDVGMVAEEHRYLIEAYFNMAMAG